MMQQSFNLDQASFATQSVKDTMVQVQAMKGASEALKSQMKDISVDDIAVAFSFSKIMMIRTFKMSSKRCLTT